MKTYWKFVAVFLVMIGGYVMEVTAEEDMAWIEIEAESVAVSEPMKVFADDAASGGKYVKVPQPGSANDSDEWGTPNGTWGFQAPYRGTYSVWIRAKLKDRYADSLYFTLDDQEEIYEFLAMAPADNEWRWYNLKTRVLAPGAHTFSVKYRDLECALDKFVVTDSSCFVPDGKGGRSEAKSQNLEYDIDIELLNQFSGQHPRLFVNREEAAQLREKIQQNASYAGLWQEVKASADRILTQSPPEYRLSADYEDGWQRAVGYNMATLAAAYLYSLAVYSSAAEKWALKSCSYPTWGREHFEGSDLIASHQLIGLSLIYDWCYDALSLEARQTILETLILRGRSIYLSSRETWRTYWVTQILQNHFYIGYGSVGITALAIYDEEPEALDWLQYAVNAYRRSFETLAADGANLEGIGYWAYGMETAFAFADNVRKLAGINMYDCEWLKNTAYYGIYLTLPPEVWESGSIHADIADCDREYSQYVGPDHIYRKLAGEYQNGYAQYIAEELDKQDLTNPKANWYNLLWYDPSVPEISVNQLGTFHHFTDFGMVSSRSGWQKDSSMLIYKNGPYAGHKVYQMRQGQELPDWGSGHVHPDNNSFLLYGNGKWLLRDDGYSPKYTGNHNTLLVNGKGQLGEGSKWFSYAEADRAENAPIIMQAYDSGDFCYMAGEGAGCYDSSGGVEQYIRNILYLKCGAAIIIDEIQTSASAELELRFFPESQDITAYGNGFLARGKTADLYAYAPSALGELTQQTVAVTVGRDSKQEQRKAFLSQKIVDGTWKNVVVFSWADSGECPVEVTVTETEDGYLVMCGGKQYGINLKEHLAYEIQTEQVVVYSRLLSGGREVSADDLQPGDWVEAEAYVSGAFANAKAPCLRLAWYQDGCLMQTSGEENILSRSAGGVKLKTDAFQIGEEYTSDDELKIFVWNSMQGMNPIQKAVE